MDNQHLDQKINQSLLLSDDRFVAFVYKKTERVAVAIYLVTNLMNNLEPIKWQLREKSIGLISSLSKVGDISFKQKVGTHVVPTLAEIISILDVARTCGLVSKMNCSVLEQELLDFAKQLQSSDSAGELSIRKQLLASGEGASGTDSVGSELIANQLRSYKGLVGESISRERPVIKDIRDIKDKVSEKSFMTPRSVKKQVVSQDTSDRRGKILTSLKNKDWLTVTEIAEFVVGVSDKTIQRDLTGLISSGTVKKAGSRRWTKYSLA